MIKQSHQQVAETILQQLGGSRFLLMTGAKDIVTLPDGVQFRLPRRGINGANRLRITLEPTDTYKVEFIWTRGVEAKFLSEYSGVYADGLVALFEQETGFVTKL